MVFVGRATLFGAAAGGEAGALHALNLLRTEVDRVIGLLGCNSVAELNPEFLRFDEAPPPEQRPTVLQRQAV
jgi:(S)-mandelate dehydrogenase